MLDLEKILEMWKADSVIDDINLDHSSQQSAKLHSKYLEMLSISKLQLRKITTHNKVLLKNKWLWYNGKLSKEEMDELGWDYDPLNGLKIMKGDMYHFYDADKDLQASQDKIEYLKVIIETLEEIIQNIRWRHSNISNMIKWRQFTSGQ